jgi:hypothetical protein
MFLCDKTKLDIYNKYGRRKDLINVKFFSIVNTNYSFPKQSYIYLCDRDFLDYIKSITNVDIFCKSLKLADISDYLDHRYAICIDSFPELLQSTIKLTNDVVYSFKCYTKDDKLDKLCKV